ncbi:ABC transporter substrate-binding protein [Roseomonas elaeocarpi]|uniref:ABC transporter substrate-binding protein n=1 Tax=Roseomonas elaeocarpi TaxID=907779 RepID=A0ABV6K0P6_9PROT
MTTGQHALERRGILRGAAAATTLALVPAALPRRARAQAGGGDTVNIINAAGNLTSAFEELMHQQNFFEKFGLRVKPLYVSDGSKLMGSVLSGQMDLCPLAGFSQVFPAVQRGAKLKITNGSVLLGQQTVFSAKPDIRSVEDLKGRTIGVGSLGAQLHQTVVALLLSKGIDPASVTFANIGSSADVFRAVVAGVVDAGPGQIDVIPQLPALGVHVVEGGDMWRNLRDYPFQGGFAADHVIASKRELLVRTLAAYGTMFRFLAGPDSRDAWFAARRAALGGKDEAFEASSDYQWRFFQTVQPFALDLAIPPERIAFLQALNVRLGVQPKPVPEEAAVDRSLPAEAVRLL